MVPCSALQLEVQSTAPHAAACHEASHVYLTTCLQAPMYWRNPFRPLATAKQLVEYVVLDIEPLGPESQKHALAEVQVCAASHLSSICSRQISQICMQRIGLGRCACEYLPWLGHCFQHVHSDLGHLLAMCHIS